MRFAQAWNEYLDGISILTEIRNQNFLSPIDPALVLTAPATQPLQEGSAFSSLSALGPQRNQGLILVWDVLVATQQTLGECAVNHPTPPVGTSQGFLCVLVPRRRRLHWSNKFCTNLWSDWLECKLTWGSIPGSPTPPATMPEWLGWTWPIFDVNISQGLGDKCPLTDSEFRVCLSVATPLILWSCWATASLNETYLPVRKGLFKE